MGTLAAGQVVIVHFPFSDLTASKLRPVLGLADAGRDDWILCQITSNPYGDARAVQLEVGDFARGSLRLTSFARPGKLFTAHASLMAGQIGELQAGTFATIREAVLRLIRALWNQPRGGRILASALAFRMFLAHFFIFHRRYQAILIQFIPRPPTRINRIQPFAWTPADV